MSSPQRQRDRVYQLLLWIIHTDTLTELMWCCFSPNRLKVWFLLLVLNATLRSTGMFTARRMQRHVRVLSHLLVDLCVIRETCHRLKSKMFPSVFTSVFYHRVKKIEGFVFRSPASQLEFTKHFLLILFPPSAPAITHQPLTLLFLLDSLFFFFFLVTFVMNYSDSRAVVTETIKTKPLLSDCWCDAADAESTLLFVSLTISFIV